MSVKLEEKRRFPRIKFNSPLRFQIRGTPAFNNTVINDISSGGIGFTADNFIPPSTNLMLEINILSHVVKPIGRVAWSSPLPHCNRYRLGIEFVELDLRDRTFLNDYIDMQEKAA